MSRYHSPFSKKKIRPKGSPPKPGLGSVPQAKSEGDSANPWTGPAGSTSPDMNRAAKFPRVKCAVNKDY